MKHAVHTIAHLLTVFTLVTAWAIAEVTWPW